MELHKHGKIWAESEGEGFGCTFIVQLPLHSLHYVAPTGYTKRGSLELPSSLLPSSSTSSNESLRNESSRNASCISTNTTNDNGNHWLEHENMKEKQLSISTNGSEHESNDGTIIERSKGRNMSTVPPLLSPKVVATDAWKPSVLVVDDSKMNRKMLVRMLISKGFACREAEDGMEGLSEMSRLDVPSTTTTRMSFSLFSGTLFRSLHPPSYYLTYYVRSLFHRYVITSPYTTGHFRGVVQTKSKFVFFDEENTRTILR